LEQEDKFDGSSKFVESELRFPRIHSFLISTNSQAPSQNSIPLSPRASGNVAFRALYIIMLTVVWLLSNISVTLVNKAVFQFANFKFPITLSALHFLVQSVFTHLYVHVFKRVPEKELDDRGTSIVRLFSLLFMVNIVVGNAALRYVTVSFRQSLQATIPAMVIPMSAIFLQKYFSLRVKLCLIPTLCGVALAAYGEMNFHPFGAFLCAMGCFFAALKAVLSNKFLTGNYKLHPFDLLNRVAPLAFLQLIPLSLVMGEAQALSKDWQNHANFHDISLIFGSALISLLLNWASFQFSQATSALTVCLAGNIRDTCTILLSVAIFGNHVGPLNACGICMAVGGSGFYSYMQYLEMKSKAAKAQPLKSVHTDSSEKSADR